MEPIPTKSRARIRLPKTLSYDPLNDSPGLLLFGLVFPFLEQHFLVSVFYFLCHKISYSFTKYLFKKARSFVFSNIMRMGKISVVEA